MVTIEELIKRDEAKLTSKNLEEFRRAWAGEIGKMPRNSDIWPHLSDEILKKTLKTRSVRTVSGVAPFAVMTMPFYCPGECVYCPLEEGMPKSYLSDEPAAQRAKRLNFDPKKQVEMRLSQLRQTGHITDKVDLIVVGGTFSVYPDDYKKEFFKGMFDGVNGVESASLEEAINYNETAITRVVGISIETRPDWVTEEEVKLWREMGVTKVQLGVQAFDEEVMKKIKRGHSLEAVAKATRMCRDAGIKICYHLMPNLPGSTPEKDIESARIMYEDERFGPDFLKIYPAMVIPNTEMYEMYQRGEYKSYSEEELKKVLKKIKEMTPVWTRIDRLVRDISKQWVASGTQKTNLRQILQNELALEGKKCHCIRCREVREGLYETDVELLINERETWGGWELFLSFEKEGKLYSLLRLRLPEEKEKTLFEELKGAAIIREVHTFGQVTPISEKEANKSQHKGLGKRLMVKAEEIARERGYKKMAVISAIGTREYYAKLGYRLEGSYIVKDL